MTKQKDHYVTAVSISDLGSVVACRCGWLGQGGVPSAPSESVEDVWNKHLLEQQ